MSHLQAIVENLASRIAAAQRGRVYPGDLLPYLPITLSMAQEQLRAMVDGSVVLESEVEGYITFEFPEFFDAPPRPLDLSRGLFASQADNGHGRWPADDPLLQRELYQLAEKTAWPAVAIKSHEILFITAGARGPIAVAEVAGRSRLTLSQLKEELKRMAQHKWARAVIDEKHGVLTYEFPPLDYPQEAFDRNDRFIRHHPSSLKDELETRLLKALAALAVIIVACFVLALFHVPRPMLMLGAPVAGAICLLRIFTRKRRLRPQQM